MLQPSSESILNALPGFIFYKRMDSVYLGCNQAMANLVGLEAPQAIEGKTDFELFQNDILVERYLADDAQTLEQGHLTVLEPTHDKDGHEITVLTSKQLYRDECGKPAGIIVQANIVPNEIISSLQSRKQIIKTYHGLTLTESKIVHYLMQGYTAKHIAVTLNRSQRTIEKHIENTKNKLGVNTKKDIIEYVVTFNPDSILASQIQC